MHEISILYSAAELAVQSAGEFGLDEISEMNLELGELSGVLPNVFTEYFDYVKAQFPMLLNAELKLRMIPGRGICDDCGTVYNVMQHEGKCPVCGSGQKTIMSGRDVKLVSIA